MVTWQLPECKRLPKDRAIHKQILLCHLKGLDKSINQQKPCLKPYNNAKEFLSNDHNMKFTTTNPTDQNYLNPTVTTHTMTRASLHNPSTQNLQPKPQHQEHNNDGSPICKFSDINPASESLEGLMNFVSFLRENYSTI